MSSLTNEPGRGHKSRWGWHPCDYATFLEIKAYHRLLLRDLRETCRRERWQAKRPHNRVQKRRAGPQTPIPEPVCRETRHDRYDWVLSEYQHLRRPAASPELVKPLDMPTDWKQNHEQLLAFYADRM